MSKTDPIARLRQATEAFPNSTRTVTTVGEIRRQLGWDVIAFPMPTNGFRGCIVPSGVPAERKQDVTSGWDLLPLPDGSELPVDVRLRHGDFSLVRM